MHCGLLQKLCPVVLCTRHSGEDSRDTNLCTLPLLPGHTQLLPGQGPKEGEDIKLMTRCLQEMSVQMCNPRISGYESKCLRCGHWEGLGVLGGIMFSITQTSPISASNLGKQNNFGPPRSICLWNGLSALLSSEAF